MYTVGPGLVLRGPGFAERGGSGSRSRRCAGSQGLPVASGFPEALPLTRITDHSRVGSAAGGAGREAPLASARSYHTPGSILRCRRRRRRPRAHAWPVLQVAWSAHQETPRPGFWVRLRPRLCAWRGHSGTLGLLLQGRRCSSSRGSRSPAEKPGSFRLDGRRCPWPERRSLGPQDLPLSGLSLPFPWARFPLGAT